MKGFLKVFLVIVVIGIIFSAIAGGLCCYCVDTSKKQFGEKNPIVLQQRAKEIANYTLPEGYEIATAINFLGVKAAVFENKQELQFMGLAEAGMFLPLNEQNFDQEITAEKLRQTLKTNQSENVEISDIEVVDRGTLQAANKSIPYAQLKLTITHKTRNETVPVEGILAVLSEQGRDILLFSVAPITKFDKSDLEEFAKNVSV